MTTDRTPDSEESNTIYSISEFCRHYRISRTLYEDMRREGKGPKELRVGTRRVSITARSALEWEKRCEGSSDPQNNPAANDATNQATG